MSMHRLCLLILLAMSERAIGAPFIIEKPTPVASKGELVENIGIGTLGGVFTPLLVRGCKLPCSSTEVFSTADDGQKQIQLFLFRGNSTLTKDARALGAFEVVGIPPERRGQPQIAITFAAEGDQISLIAVDKKTSSPLEIVRKRP